MDPNIQRPLTNRDLYTLGVLTAKVCSVLENRHPAQTAPYNALSLKELSRLAVELSIHCFLTFTVGHMLQEATSLAGWE